MTIARDDEDSLFGGVALWRRIADTIRLDIVGGKLARGEKLPGELVLAERFSKLQKLGVVNPNLDPRLLVVSLVGLTLFPLAAEPIWRRLFDADDVDYGTLERHTLALLDHNFGASYAR